MKKVLAILLMATVAFGASAKFRWGPTVGLTVNDFQWKQKLVQTDQLCGFSAGVMGELMIPGIGFGIDMAVKYTMRGARVHFGDQKVWASQGMGNENLYFHTLQIPVNLRFKWTRMNGFENYLAPIVFAGPLFNFNLDHSKCPVIENPAGSVGIQCGLGVELYKRYQITAGYLWGLTYDMRTIQLDNFSAQTNSWFVNLAVLF